MKKAIVALLITLLCTPAFAQKAEEQIVWKKGGQLPAVAGKANPGVAGAFVGVDNGVLIVAGGANFPDKLPWEGGKKAFNRDIFVFRKAGDSLQSVPVSTQLPQAVAYGASVSTPEGLVCAGGENEGGALKSVFRLNWNAEQGTIDVQSLPDLPRPVSNALLATANGRLYLAGGESNGQTVADFLMLDLNNLAAGWQKLPDLPLAVSHAVGGIQSNGDGESFFIFGGRSRNATGPSTFHTEGFAYDIKKHHWQPRQPLPGAGLSAGTGLAVGSTYILVVSGDDGSTFRQVEEVSRQLAASPDSDTLLAQRSRLLNGHPGFGRGVLFYNTITDRWTHLGDFPGAGQVTTTAVRWGNEIYLPSGEIKAGVRTPEIWQGTLLQKTYFAWLDYGVLVMYFLLMIFIGWWTSRHQHSTDDFFRGGEKIPGWATGLSIFGAKLSAITFIGIPAKTYAKDWTYFFLLMTIVMVMPFVIKYFIPFYRRINATSAYEYLEKRFNYTTRFLGAVLYILLQLGRMGIVLLLPSIALSVVTGIDVVTGIVIMSVVSIFYTVLGGIEAVIWTEVVQVIILLGGAILTLVLIPFLLEGDWQSHYQTLKNYDKLTVFDFSFDWQSSTFWVVIIGGFSLNLIQYGADQTVVQRYLTTKDQKTAEDSLRLGAWLTVPSTIIFFAIGTLLYLYYQQQPGMVNIALDSQDTIYPWFIVNELPVGIAGLVITAIFAAAMGALNGSVNCVATVFTNDLFRPFAPNLSEKTYLRTARWVTFLVGVFGMVVALLMAQMKAYSLWDQFNVILGLFTGSIGGVFMLGIFTTRANGTGVVAGLILSTVFQYWISQYTTLNLLMYAFTGLVSSLLFGYIFSLVFGAPRKSLAGLTIHEV
ncbi:sodium:solute symporter family transporter [Persicitalea jodogahamensis]|uniref:Sodium:solute symporter n=1 Tax=Persicitalea jodogahamensis TaxID=402147 RepID=A0A8J3DDG7_9BACT|nr:sodium/solute symporter [Persicitalea jodogahamensis]GHB86932.1 sodium:solute symporter [Persicitalea jodogahamensis]